MMSFSDVIHRLVDNSPAFNSAESVEAHKAIADHLGDEDRHPMVPSPEAEQAAEDDRAAKRADLEAQLAALDAEGGSQPAASSEPVTVADQKAAGVPDDQTVTVADQRAGAEPPTPPSG